MGAWAETLAEPRLGIMLHYDASASDPGAVAWMRDPRCKVSYNWLILDDAGQVTVAPTDARAYHAGKCKSSDPARLPYTGANSAFYGLAIAATDGEVATAAQEEWVAQLCVALFRRHGWSRQDELWRIVGHDTEAFPLGRKHDPTGSDPAHPVLSVARIRAMVAPARFG